MASTLIPRPSGLSRQCFVARYGGIYEHSPWVAEAVFAQGIISAVDEPGVLAKRMAAIVEAAGPERQLGLLRAHPELAGRLAMAGSLTASSKAEQAAARLDACTPAEFARFQELNSTYTAKFGFPFIIAVRGLSRSQILGAFEFRIGNEPDDEFKTALAEVHKIAHLRLEAMAAE